MLFTNQLFFISVTWLRTMWGHAQGRPKAWAIWATAQGITLSGGNNFGPTCNSLFFFWAKILQPSHVDLVRGKGKGQ